MKKYQGFLSENFKFLGLKFSIYLNRRVFVMYSVDMGIKGSTLLDGISELCRF